MAARSRDDSIAAIDDLFHDIFGKALRPETPPSRELNITMGQMHCMHTIAHLGNPTMSEIAEALQLHPSTVTVLVDGLVSHGLVRRKPDPRDRRIVRVSETAKGRHNHERHNQEKRARLSEMLSGLSDTDLQRVLESLALLREAAREYAERRKAAAPPKAPKR